MVKHVREKPDSLCSSIVVLTISFSVVVMELDCTALTPKTVLDVSGHTEKFCDYLVTRRADDQAVRADHLLEEWIDAALDDDSKPLTADIEVCIPLRTAYFVVVVVIVDRRCCCCCC
jgi:glycyl-tRNA synthetase (class II)